MSPRKVDARPLKADLSDALHMNGPPEAKLLLFAALLEARPLGERELADLCRMPPADIDAMGRWLHNHGHAKWRDGVFTLRGAE